MSDNDNEPAGTDTTDGGEDLDEPTFEDIAGVHLSFSLTWDELDVLQADHGVALLPLLPVEQVRTGDGRASLEERDIIVDGQLTEAGDHMIGLVLRPSAVVAVERIGPELRHLWYFHITDTGFAEQTQLPGGLHWFLAEHEKLMGRILLNSGAFRLSADESDDELVDDESVDEADEVLDPLPDEEHFDVVIATTLYGQQDVNALLVRHDRGRWTVGPDTDHQVEPTPEELADTIVDFVASGLGADDD